MEYIVVIVLVCYIAFIHYQMNKKNHLIEKMVDKLGKLEKDWDINHILNLLEKNRLQQSTTKNSRNKLFDEPVLKFLFSNEDDSKIYIHYTKDENTAKNISKEGFRFVETFEKTAEQVFNDSVDLTYKHNVRKYYGNYIVVICIPNNIYNHYYEELKLLNKQNAQPEQVLSGIPTFLNDNQEEVFTLSKQFIKGYINYETGFIVHNHEFRPRLKSYLKQDQLN